MAYDCDNNSLSSESIIRGLIVQDTDRLRLRTINIGGADSAYASCANSSVSVDALLKFLTASGKLQISEA